MSTRLPAVLGCTMLGACSTIATPPPASVQATRPLQLDYCVHASAERNVFDKTLADAEAKQQFDDHIQHAVSELNQYLASHLAHSPDLLLYPLPDCDAAATDLQQGLLLEMDIAGYGTLKPKWKHWLIGTGAAEATVQGIAVNVATHNPWLALAVGAEEMTSEYLTWNGIDWLLGETFAPVTLEATLTDRQSHTVLWQDSDFITDNEKELDKLGKDVKKDKAVQLAASQHKAQHRLVKRLNGYLEKEIIGQGDHP